MNEGFSGAVLTVDGEGGYVFGYDAATLAALDSLAVDERPDQGQPR